MKSIQNLIASVLTLLAVSATISPNSLFAANGMPEGFYVEPVGTNLSKPTSMAFGPDGRIYVAEKDGKVKIVNPSQPGNIQTLMVRNDVNDYNDRGVIGIAVDPEFNQNGHLYLAYTYENLPNLRNLPPNSRSGQPGYDAPKTARVVRFTVNGNSVVEGSSQIILGSVGGDPANPSCNDFPNGVDCIASDSGSHSIGGIRFGNDGKLYVATGDGAGFYSVDLHAFRAQDLDHLSGKILRINKDGTAPADNPFYNGDAYANRSKVFAYGLRNPYRFNFHPWYGNIFGGDVGWYNAEEINYIQAGKNYGWPCKEGSNESFNGYELQLGCPIVTETTDPVFEYDHVPLVNRITGQIEYNTDGSPKTIGAVTGGAFATSDRYPEFFRGSYLFGDVVLDYMKFIRFNDQSQVVSVSDFATSNVGVPVEFVTGPDGLVYYISLQFESATAYSGEIRRFNYNADANIDILPIAEFTSTVTSTAPFIGDFDASASRDPAGRNLTYDWNFGDGQNGQGQRVNHTYSQAGTYTVELTLRTDQGTEMISTREITFDASANSLNSEPYLESMSITKLDDQTSVVDGGNVFIGTNLALLASIGNQRNGLPFGVQIQVERKEPGFPGVVVYSIDNPQQQTNAGQTFQWSPEWTPAQLGRYSVTVNFYTHQNESQEFGPKTRFYIDTAIFNVVTRDPGSPVVNEPIAPPNPVATNCTDTPPLGNNKGWNGDNCHVNGDPWVPGVSDAPDYQPGDTATGSPVVNEPIAPTNPVATNCTDTPPLGNNKGWNGDNCHVNGDPWVPGVSDAPDYQPGDTATGSPVVNEPIAPTNPVATNCTDTPPLGNNKGWNGDNCHVNGDPWVPGVSDAPDYQPGDTATGSPVVNEPIAPTNPVATNCTDTPPLGNNKGWNGDNCHVNGDPWVPGVSDAPDYQPGDTATGSPVVNEPIAPTNPVATNCTDTPPLGNNKGWNGDNCHVNGDPWVPGVSDAPDYQPGDTAVQ